MELSHEQQAEIGRLVTKAWSDPAFKNALLTDANAALAAEGITLGGGVHLKVHANSASTLHFVLPDPPSEALSDEALDSVAGGMNFGVSCYSNMNVCSTACP